MPKRFSESFDPDSVRAMMAAFDKACEMLGLTYGPNADAVARAIVAQARTGERDPHKLCALTCECCSQTILPRRASSGALGQCTLPSEVLTALRMSASLNGLGIYGRSR